MRRQPVRSVRSGPGLGPVIADAKAEVARVLAEPHRIAEISATDIPALLGHLEQARAALWARMIREPVPASRDRADDAADEVLTVPEVARELRFTRAYVYEAVRRGDLHAVRKGRYVRIMRHDLRVWLEGRPPKGLDAQAGARDSSRHAAARVGPRSGARASVGVSPRIRIRAQPLPPPAGNGDA